MQKKKGNGAGHPHNRAGLCARLCSCAPGWTMAVILTVHPWTPVSGFPRLLHRCVYVWVTCVHSHTCSKHFPTVQTLVYPWLPWTCSVDQARRIRTSLEVCWLPLWSPTHNVAVNRRDLGAPPLPGWQVRDEAVRVKSHGEGTRGGWQWLQVLPPVRGHGTDTV